MGAAPLSVNFSAANSYDHDKDDLQYAWMVEGEEVKTKVPSLSHVFETPGIYEVELNVSDANGSNATTNKKILVGNEPPEIKINLGNENTTYWANKKLDYRIDVVDLEDGSTGDATIDPSKVKITFNYIPEGEDMILASIGHQQNAVPKGLELIRNADCEACHAEQKRVAGPSYQDIAARYTQKDKQKIIHSIIKGSQGTWGDAMMSPHPQLEIEAVEEMVNYILSLDPEMEVNETSLPLEGTITFDKHRQDDATGKYVLMASYLDDGNPDVKESQLSAIQEFVFIHPRIELEDAIDLDESLSVWNSQDKTVVGSIKDGKQIRVAEVSFERLTSVKIGAAFNKEYEYKGTVEVRQGNNQVNS